MARFRVTFISRDNRARILVVEAASRSEALIKAGPAREGESVTVEEDSWEFYRVRPNGLGLVSQRRGTQGGRIPWGP